MNILWEKKRSDLSLKLELINVVFRVGIVFAMFKTGILWVCISLCIAEFFNFLVYAKIIEKVSAYGLVKQIKDIVPIIFFALVSSFITYYFIISHFDNNIIKIIVGIISIATIYTLLLFIKRGYEIKEILKLITKKV